MIAKSKNRIPHFDLEKGLDELKEWLKESVDDLEEVKKKRYEKLPEDERLLITLSSFIHILESTPEEELHEAELALIPDFVERLKEIEGELKSKLQQTKS